MLAPGPKQWVGCLIWGHIYICSLHKYISKYDPNLYNCCRAYSPNIYKNWAAAATRWRKRSTCVNLKVSLWKERKITSAISSVLCMGQCRPVTPGGTNLTRPTHWGQRGFYLAGKLRVFFEILNNLPAFYPAGKLRVDSKIAHHFDSTLISG